MTTFVTFLLWVVVILGIWTVLHQLCKLTKYLWRAEQTAVGDFLADGQVSPIHAAKFRDRWLEFRDSGGGPISLSGLPFPGGADFILAEIEQRSVSDLQKSIGEIGKDLEFKLAGVSLQGLAQLLEGMTNRPHRLIEGRISRFGNEVGLTVTLSKDDVPLKVWSANKSLPAGKEKEGQAAAEEALIDEAICELAIYIKENDASPANKGKANMVDATKPLSARALAELKKGRRSLERYAQDYRQDDLLEAQKHFRLLVSNSPTYTDGYMLLSQSLAENRQEREAIEIYDRALDLLKKGGPQADDRREFEARFLKASSLLRCYRWADVNNARKEFTNLASELERLTKTKPTAAAGGESKTSLVDRWRDDIYMLARCHAEAAHCFGHMIVLLPKDRPVPADFLPDLAELKLLKEGGAQTKLETNAERQEIVRGLYRLAGEEQKIARNVTPIYPKQRGDLEARLSEVRGYARYRSAEWLPNNDDTKFRGECREAIRDLQDAELHWPRDYALLQNIGMIYLNRRYSSEIDALESAGRYFLRSVDLKPADYFAYERLGWVGLRRALQTGDGKAREEVLKEAEERASRAIQLAPQSRSAQLIRLYLGIARLGTTGNTAKKEDVASLIADIDSQDPDGKDFSRRWMRLACGWFGLIAAADSAAWYGGKTILLQEADKFVEDSKADSIWRVVQMRESIARFRKDLKTLAFEDRTKLRFELGAACD